MLWYRSADVKRHDDSGRGVSLSLWCVTVLFDFPPAWRSRRILGRRGQIRWKGGSILENSPERVRQAALMEIPLRRPGPLGHGGFRLKHHAKRRP